MRNLKNGGAFDYRVTETKAPNGYKLDSTAKDFVVKDGNAEFVNEWSYDDASFLNNDLELHLIKNTKNRQVIGYQLKKLKKL